MLFVDDDVLPLMRTLSADARSGPTSAPGGRREVYFWQRSIINALLRHAMTADSAIDEGDNLMMTDHLS